jgi:hypothetical protein
MVNAGARVFLSVMLRVPPAMAKRTGLRGDRTDATGSASARGRPLETARVTQPAAAPRAGEAPAPRRDRLGLALEASRCASCYVSVRLSARVVRLLAWVEVSQPPLASAVIATL